MATLEIRTGIRKRKIERNKQTKTHSLNFLAQLYIQKLQYICYDKSNAQYFFLYYFAVSCLTLLDKKASIYKNYNCRLYDSNAKLKLYAQLQAM